MAFRNSLKPRMPKLGQGMPKLGSSLGGLKPKLSKPRLPGLGKSSGLEPGVEQEMGVKVRGTKGFKSLMGSLKPKMPKL